MKNLTWILVAAVLVTTNAFAKDVAVYEFGTTELSVESSRNYQSVRVSLDHNGVIKAELYPLELGGPDLPRPILEVVSKQLSPLALQNLRNQFIGLSNTELESYEAQAICMIAVSPDMMIDHLYVAEGYDYNIDHFTGELRLVLSAQGCWVGHGTYPKNQYAQQNARNLKALLRFYALDLLNK